MPTQMKYLFSMLLPLCLTATSPFAWAEGSLKDAYKGEFLIGTALNNKHFAEVDPQDETLVAGQFNSITPENVLKWEAVHPGLDRYNFDQADRFVAFGEKHGMFIVGHTLVWHQQLPKWVLKENGQPVSREVALQRMRDHIQTVMGRYKGRIQAWDVVNEALDDKGALRKSPWHETVGEDYIIKAFEFAHEADPQAELYYNDYSLENEPKRRGAIELVKKLQAAGVKIHGVGIQGHSKMSWPSIGQLDATLTELGQLGIKTMMTEVDIDVLPGAKNNGSAEITDRQKADPALNPYTAGLPEEMQEKLAQRYADFFTVYRKHRGTLSRVTFWGVTDAGSWLNGWPIPGRSNYPLLFDREGKPKPAFQAVLKVAGTEGQASESATPEKKEESPAGEKKTPEKADSAPQVDHNSQSKPNIVIFIADDLSWHDVACFGGPTDAKTPNLDQLAREGMKLTKFYSPAAVCSPTRQALLTGLYPVRSGAYPNHAMVKKGMRSLPSYLESLGYRTLGAGKKHFDPKESYPFSTWLPMVGGNPDEKKEEGFLDLEGLKKFIQADPAHPFFAYLATHEPHGPHSLGDASAYPPESLKNIAPYLVDTPELRRMLSKYYAEVALCDEQVGQVREILKKTGQEKNTIFIFASEQGSSVPQGKWSLYDPGIRVAAIVAWPGQIAAGSSSAALMQYVDIAPTLMTAAGGDPTQVDSGVADTSGYKGFDGKSMLDVLLGKKDTLRDFIFAEHTARGINDGPEAYGTRAVSDGRWKLLVNLEPENKFTCAISDAPLIRSWREKGEKGDQFAASQAARFSRRPAVELYDLEKDPWELTNVADRTENKGTLARLETELAGWMKQQGDKGHETEMEAYDHQPRMERKGKKKSAGEPITVVPIESTESLFFLVA